MRLNSASERFEDQEYPATTAEIVSAHGNVPIQLADGIETVGDVLERSGNETFYCPEDVVDALRAGVSAEAVGRRHYSDRDAFTPGEDGPAQLSF